VLAILVVCSFVLLTVTYGQGSDGLQRGVCTIFSPLQVVADRALKPARDMVGWFDKTFEARGENSRLRTELVRSRELAVAGQAALQENEQLRKLLKFDQGPPLATSPYDPVTARVIARGPTAVHSKNGVDVGSGDGVGVDDPVMSGDGLIGRVSSVEGSAAQVELITDNASAISAKVLPGGTRGVIRPDLGDPEDLILDYLDATEKIGVGQAVVTSGWCTQGLCSLFPPNLPVGEITRASIVEQEASQQVRLRPYADLANLDLVQVLTGGSRR
jgi:rod shape-determining protein MreC